MKHSRTNTLLTLLVFAAFVLTTLGVLLTGAGVYRRMVTASEESFAERTWPSYFATKVRQARGVRVEDFGGCPALVLEDTIEGEDYLTRVYVYDGYLRELFSPADVNLSPQDGEKILEAENLALEVTGDLLTITLGGQVQYLALPTGQEGLP